MGVQEEEPDSRLNQRTQDAQRLHVGDPDLESEL